MKRNLSLTLVSAAVMILLPLCAVNTVSSRSGMLFTLVLFLAVNPAAAIYVGISSGKQLRGCWFQPLLLSCLFLLGVRLAFRTWDISFLWYAAGYLVIGAAAALLTFWRKTE